MRVITTEVFIEEVITEIKHIKKYATEVEINRLDFKTFNGFIAKSCIYGQMTGNCHSERATELCSKSIHEITIMKDGTVLINENTDTVIRLTAMEKYLFHSSRKQHRKIINYLKGECDKLDLKVDQRTRKERREEDDRGISF